MDIIALNEELKEKYPINVDIDFEVGDTSASNDFELTESGNREYALHIPETEYGGVIEYENEANCTEEKTFKGWTWRGLLTQWIISPATGEDYKKVSGEANEILKEILADVFDGFFDVPQTDSGLVIRGYQFERYCSVLAGLTKMLNERNYRLRIYSKRERPGERIRVYCEAVPIKKINGTYDDDTGLELEFTDDKMGINHLICLGKGELQERQRIDLYLDTDGNISETKQIAGFLERQAVYDYGNAETLDDLKTKGIERLKEIASTKKLKINEVSEVDLEIGDIVVGRKNEMGLIVEQPIVRKILKISGGKETIEYKVEGEG